MPLWNFTSDRPQWGTMGPPQPDDAVGNYENASGSITWIGDQDGNLTAELRDRDNPYADPRVLTADQAIELGFPLPGMNISATVGGQEVYRIADPNEFYTFMSGRGGRNANGPVGRNALAEIGINSPDDIKYDSEAGYYIPRSSFDKLPSSTPNSDAKLVGMLALMATAGVGSYLYGAAAAEAGATADVVIGNAAGDALLPAQLPAITPEYVNQAVGPLTQLTGPGGIPMVPPLVPPSSGAPPMPPPEPPPPPGLPEPIPPGPGGVPPVVPPIPPGDTGNLPRNLPDGVTPTGGFNMDYFGTPEGQSAWARLLAGTASAADLLKLGLTAATAATLVSSLGGGSGLGGDRTTTTNINLTPAPRTAEQIELERLQIAAFQREAELNSRLTPVIQRQIDAQNAALDREAAHNQQTIHDVGYRIYNDPNLTPEQRQTQISALMRQYGVTATEVADASGQFTPEQIAAYSGVNLTTAERQAATQQELSDIALARARQGTNATPEQIEQIDTAFFGSQEQRALNEAHDPATIRRYITNITGNSSLSVQEKEDQLAALAPLARQYGITSSEITAAMPGASPELIQRISGLGVTPGEQSSRRPEWGGAYGAGLAEIDRFTSETLARINEEVAAASGLSPTDTPITALNDRAAAEVIRQRGVLSSNMQSGAATAKLNYPLAAQQVQNATLNSAGSLNLASQQFQQQLEQTAANNRYRLFSNPFQLPQTSTGAGQYALGLGNQNVNLASRNATSTGPGPGLADYGQFFGGLGSIVHGGSSLGLW